jgi:hypothetical protein
LNFCFGYNIDVVTISQVVLARLLQKSDDALDALVQMIKFVAASVHSLVRCPSSDWILMGVFTEFNHSVLLLMRYPKHTLVF